MLNILNTILNDLESNKLYNIYGAKGLSKAQISCYLSKYRPILFIASTQNEAEHILQDIRFFFKKNHNNVLFLPNENKTPYHMVSPDPIIAIERIATLHALSISSPFRILVTSIKALIEKYPIKYIKKTKCTLKHNENINRLIIVEKIKSGGYHQVITVKEQGTFAIIGSNIDIFCPGTKNPVRIEFFGNIINSIKFFNLQNQNTICYLKKFSFGPTKEIPLNEQSCQLAINNLKLLSNKIQYSYEKLDKKIFNLNDCLPFFGIENLVPAFHDKLNNFLEFLIETYLKDNLLVIIDKSEKLNKIINKIHENYKINYNSALTRGELCFHPNKFLITKKQFDMQIESLSRLLFNSLNTKKNNVKTIQVENINLFKHKNINKNKTQNLLTPLSEEIRKLKNNNISVFLPATSLNSIHRIKELLKIERINVFHMNEQPDFLNNQHIKKLDDKSIHAFTFIVKSEAPSCGFVFPTLNLCIITEDEIFGKKVKHKVTKEIKNSFKTSLSDLNEGDAIVHINHGIGIFKGLHKLNVQGIEHDYVLLNYAKKDKLYLPVYLINLIQPYSTIQDKPIKLDKLGRNDWKIKKSKIKQEVLIMAQDLLNIYAKREMIKRPFFPKPNNKYLEFESKFPFETTHDQQKAIDDVLNDMQKSKPMDRLICGDVGYGKTEVAMRASMLSILASRQVAILAPTTILAQQHAITFSQRFENTNTNINVISRFQKLKTIKKILKETKDGYVNILIGTHRLLSNDVKFKNLGLVIIDEEQRFGIKAKEQLKKFRINIDVIAMSATPIPRTLQMSYFGIRDLSIIKTPPIDRQAIRTSIIKFNDEIVRKAILYEIHRNGQVYFVHNHINSIEAKTNYLKRLVPEANIEIGHGKMHANKLENIMVRFMNHEFNVFVCTTIIETGIDVSSANTMFIDNADEFGLAQLYQLRGRIGRSKEKAFAYLIISTNSTKQLSNMANKRLEVFNKFSELGAGFNIAQHDLELRGAGDILGKKQHGHISTVGYNLYTNLLKEAVNSLKKNKYKNKPEPEIILPVLALIPEKYMKNLHDRMSIYEQMASSKNKTDIENILNSIEERFGQLPNEIITLSDIILLKQILQKFGIVKLQIGELKSKYNIPKVILTLNNDTKLNIKKLKTFIHNNSNKVLITPQMKLIYTPNQQEWEINSNKNIIKLCNYAIKIIITTILD